MERPHIDAATAEGANDLDAAFAALMQDTGMVPVHLEGHHSTDHEGGEFDDIYTAFMTAGQAGHPVALGAQVEFNPPTTSDSGMPLEDTYVWKLVTDTYDDSPTLSNRKKAITGYDNKPPATPITGVGAQISVQRYIQWVDQRLDEIIAATGAVGIEAYMGSPRTYQAIAFAWGGQYADLSTEIERTTQDSVIRDATHAAYAHVDPDAPVPTDIKIARAASYISHAFAKTGLSQDDKCLLLKAAC